MDVPFWKIVTISLVCDRTRILERTNEGRIDAKHRGIKFGRKIKVNYDEVKSLHDKGVKV